ncbi:MAG: polysaccharide biosynthesis protein [Hyphomonadaceae bacterium]
MSADVVLAGTAAAINAALEHRAQWAPAGLAISGVAILGDGEVSHASVFRAERLQDFDPAVIAPADLVLAQPLPNAVVARALLARAAEAGVKISLIEHGRLRRLRMDDLVGRALGPVDWSRISALIEGKRVLITGGGGTIGGELARRVASLNPARLTLVDSSEYNLHAKKLELKDAVVVLADIRSAKSVRRWFEREQPDIVFHAAALKQVPMVEAFPSEGVLTNVVGLRNVADAAHEVGADLIFVSTDKAVQPSGVMGASKRLGEMYCQALDRKGGLRAVPVRLGNVLGSTGSVSPMFADQLANGGPLTVTHADVTRFFLSIPQAADVLLQGGAISVGSSRARGAALVVEMGDALPVIELARDVVRLEGKRPDVDVPIVITGMRPGEKLHEMLVAPDEWREPDPAPGVMAAASAAHGLAELSALMDRLAELAEAGDEEAIAAELLAAVKPPSVVEEQAVAS